MTYQLGISVNAYTLTVQADEVVAATTFVAGALPPSSAIGRALISAADDAAARTAINAAPTNRRSGHVVFDPTFTRALISGGDGMYRHEATGCQDVSGKLHAFYAGNPGSASESVTGQVIYHMTSTNGGATWSTPVSVASETATNTLTPTATQAIARCVAVGNEVWLFFGNRGTAGQEALIWGRLSASGVWTWARLRVDASNVPAWSTSDLTGAAAAGYTLTMNILGDTVTLVPTDVLARSDGGVDLLLIGVTSFGATHHMFLTRMTSAGAFSLIGSPIPSGEDYTPDPWEGSLVALPEGGYVVHARRLLVAAGQSAIPIEAGKRQVRAESPDGIGWTAWEPTGMRTHSSKASIAALSSSRWVIACSGSWSTRNDVCIGVSSDPRQFVTGPLASNEDITTDYAEYPAVFVYSYQGSQRIGVLYSGRPQTAPAPCEIRWASCAVPADGAYLAQTTPQRANRSDATAVSASSGQTITVPPKASMSWEPVPYDVMRRAIRWKVDTVPGGVPYIIASIGNYQCWTQVYLVSNSGAYLLKVDGQVIGAPITDPTQWQTLVIEIDKRAGVCRVMGRSVALSWQGISVTSGDAYDVTGFSSGAAGTISIDASQCTVAEAERLAYASVASDEGGPNVFGNPEFSIDQRFQGAAYGNGVGDKLDLTYLADNGGCGLTIQQTSFSLSAALSYSGGVQTHLKIARTSAGASAPQLDCYLGDVGILAGKPVMVEFDAYDAASQSYYMEVWAVHNFGSGGSATASYRLGVVLIGPNNGPRHGVECFWPTINGTPTVGTDNFCALQFRPAFHALASNADLRIGRLDVHSGKLKRPFQRVDQSLILAECQRYFRSIRALQAFGNFGIAYAASTTEARLPLSRDNFRKLPTITSAGSFQLAGPASATATVSSVARQVEGGVEVVLSATGLTKDQSYQVRDNGSADAALFLSARYR